MEATGFDGLTDDYKFHNLYADWAGIPPRNYPLILPQSDPWPSYFDEYECNSFYI